MTRPLARGIFCFQITILSILFTTSFLVKPDFFNWMVTSKQWGLEQVLLLTVLSLVVSFPFIKTIQFSIIDLLVLAFCGWYILSEVYIFYSPYISLSDTIFSVALWLTVYLFVRSVAQMPAFVLALLMVWMMVSLLQSGLD